jgi:hypothetical protein
MLADTQLWHSRHRITFETIPATACADEHALLMAVNSSGAAHAVRSNNIT